MWEENLNFQNGNINLNGALIFQITYTLLQCFPNLSGFGEKWGIVVIKIALELRLKGLATLNNVLFNVRTKQKG